MSIRILIDCRQLSKTCRISVLVRLVRFRFRCITISTGNDASTGTLLATSSVRGVLYMIHPVDSGSRIAHSSCLAVRRQYLRQGGYVFIGASQFLCLLVGLRKNYSADFYEIRWKGGAAHGPRKKP